MASATYTCSYLHGEFKTAYLQRAVKLVTKTGSQLLVGDLVTLTGDSADTYSISKAQGSFTGDVTSAVGKENAEKAALANATHMVAAMDDVFTGNKAEYGDYTVTGVVAQSTGAAKRVLLYPLFDKTDIRITDKTVS